MGDWDIIFNALNNHPPPSERVYKRLKVVPLEKKKKKIRFISRRHVDWPKWTALAIQMQRNMELAKKELRDELMRMDGKLVFTDYAMGPLDVDYVSEYTLDPEFIRMKVQANTDSESDSSI